MQPALVSSKPSPGYHLISSYYLASEPDHTTGSVHSVFRSSLNIEVDGRLIHLGMPPHPLSCLGMNVDPALLTPLLADVQPGNLVVFKKGSIRIYSTESVYTIDYTGYTPIDLNVKYIAGFPVNKLLNELGKLDLSQTMGIPMDGRCLSMLKILEQKNCDTGTLARCIRYLLGRGKGLTPSGDDIMMGYGAGRLVLGDAEEFLNVLSGIVSHQTTAVSTAYLKALCKGYVNHDYIQLFESIQHEKKNDVSKWLQCIRTTGHTSGSDSLYGLQLSMNRFRNK